LTKLHKFCIHFTDLGTTASLFMEIGQSTAQHDWFTAKEAAGYIGVTTTTLYAYIKMRKGKPPFFRLAGKPKGVLRFPREEFIRWANGAQKQ
jgi:hypothetical protein